MTRVKICGITRIQDAELAIELGADAIGFVFEPTSPRCIANNKELIEFARLASGFTTTVAVFGHCDHEPGGFDRTQFVEHSTKIIRPLPVMRFASGTNLDVALDRVGLLPGIHVVIDAFDPSAYGGTGVRADWDLVKQIVDATDKKVILAGGLNADNVGEAISAVRPYAVDVSSGVESAPGIKDREAVRAFLSAARQ